MITDIFANRYRDIQIWSEFSENERRLLVQAFRIVAEQIEPSHEWSRYTHRSEVSISGKTFYSAVERMLSMEFGLQNLLTGFTGFVSCNGWYNFLPKHVSDANEYIKQRLSFIELCFRMKEKNIEKEDRIISQKMEAFKEQPLRSERDGSQAPIISDIEKRSIASHVRTKKAFDDSVNELNTRFQHASFRVHYHAGFIQLSDDRFISEQIDGPFWRLVADSEWTNVEADMKQAVDLRDSGRRDPAFYAAMALESAIKIISDKKNWSRGGEKGAHNYIDNLAAKNRDFIQQWEAKLLKEFFSSVRNPHSHGSGSEPMMELSKAQTNWAIEYCMSWTRSLITRL